MTDPVSGPTEAGGPATPESPWTYGEPAVGSHPDPPDADSLFAEDDGLFLEDEQPAVDGDVDGDVGGPLASGAGLVPGTVEAPVDLAGAPADSAEVPGGECVPAGVAEVSVGAEVPAGATGRSGTAYETAEWRGIVLVTGTDTEVGKTVVTAAVTAAASAAGLRVAVIKPGQTGVPDGPSDVDTIVRLAGPATARTLSTYPDPLAPLAAARIRGMAPLEIYAVVDAVRAEAKAHDLVLVEGAGGLLVPMGLRPSGQAWTLADLAVSLGAPVIVVTRAGLGTLNHTALTLEALDRRGVPAGVVLGAWPAEPGLVHWANFTELIPGLMGALPAGAGGMDPGVFRRSAPGWLTPCLFGVLDDWRAWADEA